MKRTESGYAGIIGIVVSLLICFLLIVLYLRAFTPGGPKGGVEGTALEAARKQAQNFEDQQRKRIEEMNQVNQQP